MIKGASEILDGEGSFADVGVRAVDEHTLEFTLKTPLPRFLTLSDLWLLRSDLCGLPASDRKRLGQPHHLEQ